eukprot:5524631-Pyramimonas_sp.AAC.1
MLARARDQMLAIVGDAPIALSPPLASSPARQKLRRPRGRAPARLMAFESSREYIPACSGERRMSSGPI